MTAAAPRRRSLRRLSTWDRNRILHLNAHGWRDTRIADRLGISVATVNYHTPIRKRPATRPDTRKDG